MHDYIVGGLARSHQDDLMREVLHEELRTEARQASDEAAAPGRARHGLPFAIAHLHAPHLHAPRLHAPHLHLVHHG